MTHSFILRKEEAPVCVACNTVITVTHIFILAPPSSPLKPLTAKYVYQVWQKEWDETGLVSNKFHEILPKLPDKLLSFCNTRKENIVLNRLHIGHSYLTHSFILRREEAPVCVACDVVLTVKHILLECADLLDIRKKYFEENPRREAGDV